MQVEYKGCVGCPSEMGCLGEACPQRYTETVCDYCGGAASHNYMGENVCEDCLERFLDGAWRGLSTDEKIEALGADCEEFD